MTGKALKFSTMVGEIFKICWSQMTGKALKLSTVVGENFEICWTQVARNALKLSKMSREILKYAGLKRLEMYLNRPP